MAEIRVVGIKAEVKREAKAEAARRGLTLSQFAIACIAAMLVKPKEKQAKCAK